MDTAVLKQKIIAKAKELGIVKIGFASAEPFTHLERACVAQRTRSYIGFEHPVLKSVFILRKSSILQNDYFHCAGISGTSKE